MYVYPNITTTFHSPAHAITSIITAADKPILTCKGCKAAVMTIRKNPRGFMIGCRGFPNCKGASRRMG